jgi:hypothetical protein
MDIAKTYWLLNDKINQPKVDYYQYSNKTPYQRGLEALDYFRYYGGKPLNIEKTYYNRLLMPIFDDLDLFQLKITNIFVEIKEFQQTFQTDNNIKDLVNLNKTIPILVKDILKHNKNHIKSIKEELKLTKNGIKDDIRQIFSNRTILLPFVQYMQHRELKTQENMKNIRLKFIMNSNKVKNLRENILVEENLIDKMEAKKEVERFNEYLINFKKDLESRARVMKIERLKMKVNDVQMTLEKETTQNDEIPKIKRKIVCLGYYKYDDIKSDKKSSKNNNKEKSSKKSGKSSKSKKSKSNLTKSKNSKTKNKSSFSEYIKSELNKKSNKKEESEESED